MIYFDRANPSVTTAAPVSQAPTLSQAFCNSPAPAAEKIAPQTPEPFCRALFAAFTIASAFTFVISVLIISKGIFVTSDFSDL